MTLHARARVDVLVVAPHRTAFDTANDRRRPRRLEDALTTSHGRLANDTAGTVTTSASASASVTLARARVTADDIVAVARSRESTRDVSRRLLAHTRGRRCDSWDSHARRHLSRSQTRRARLPKHPKNKHAAGNCCYTARTVPEARRRLRRVRRHTRRHTGFEPNPSIISLFEDTNSKPCSVFYVHFSSRDWSILRFYPPSDAFGEPPVSSRVVAARRATERTSARGSSVRVRA